MAKYADVRELRVRHAGEFLTIGRTESKLPRDLVIRQAGADPVQVSGLRLKRKD